MNKIKKRLLGRTGQKIAEIGLGGVFIAGHGGNIPDESIQVVQRSLELGVDYIDTAPLYGNSQVVLGEALRGSTEGYLLGTKCGRWDWRTGPYRNLDPYKVQLEKSLSDLRRDSVDILYIHEADWAVYWEDMDIPRKQMLIDQNASYDYAAAPVFQFLQWAREQGFTRYIGISGNNAHLLAKVLKECPLEIDVVLVALQYSLIWRNAREHFLPVGKQMDVGVVLGGPLQQGRLSVPHREWLENPPDWMDEDTRGRFESLYEIHEETGMTLAEMTVRFLLADPYFTTVIPGAANVEQLEENMKAAAAGPLPQELYDRLDALGKIF